MKKLFLTLILVIGVASWANATIEVTADTGDGGPANTSVNIVVDTTDGNPPDSAVRQYTLLWGTSANPTTRQDSITGSHTFPDTFAMTGLENGSWYHYRVEYIDSVTTDTTASDSFQTDDVVQTLTIYDTTTSEFSVGIEVTGADSAESKIVLIVGLIGGSKTRADSTTSINNNDDSLTATGLTHNKTYEIFTICDDSTSTDTSAFDTLLMEGIGIATSVYDTTYRNFNVGIELTNLDSAANKIVLVTKEITDATVEVYSRVDSATSINNDDDSLEAAPTPYDLTKNANYAWFIIVTDSTGTDSSTIDTIDIDDFPWYAYNNPQGWVTSNVAHATWTWDESQDAFTSDNFSINDSWGGKIWARVIGEDNNRTFDSLYLIVYSGEPTGDLNAIDTLITAEADTGTYTVEYIWRPIAPEDSVWKNRLGYEDWGLTLELRGSVTDSSESVGDTMDLDDRYLDIWLEFYK